MQDAPPMAADFYAVHCYNSIRLALFKFAQ